MEYLMEMGVFAGKMAILVVSGLIVMAGIALLIFRKQQHEQEHLEIYHLNEKLDNYTAFLKSSLFSKKEWKKELKEQKTEKKKKEATKVTHPLGRVFVLQFEGDIKANQVDKLRQEISILIKTIQPKDEVILKLESPGGMVHGYGLAAAQLMRLRRNNIPLTVCIDKVAASGGYLMAVTANHIVAAPFAIVGSIGVVAQIPNFNRLLKKYDVDYEEVTAGEYKRTMSVLGEITEKGRQKFTEQIEETHQLFKEFVHKCRPSLSLNRIATGEYWFGERALDLQLIDEIKTSDEILMEKMKEKDVFFVKLSEKLPLSEKIAKAIGQSSQLILDKIKTFSL